MTGKPSRGTITTVAAAACLLLSFTGNVLGAPAEDGKKGPPQFAIDACKGHKEGDSVQATKPNGETVSGTCRTIEGTLVFVPPGFNGPQGGGVDGAGRRPPQFAIDACKGHAEGDAVQIKDRRGETVSGTCRMIDGTLTLMPAGANGPPQGGAGFGQPR